MLQNILNVCFYSHILILVTVKSYTYICNTVDSFSGDPKGAMLTHENVVADAASFVKSFEVLYFNLVAKRVIAYLVISGISP